MSDPRSHFADIAKEMQKSSEELVFLTPNSADFIVSMRMEAYKEDRYESGSYNKLRKEETTPNGSA